MKSGLLTNALSSGVSALFFIFILASCTQVHKLGKRPAAEPPYITLKSGDTIHGKQVYEEMGFQGSGIVADNTVYPRADVVSFSDGEQTFHKLFRGTFGPKIAEGKINVYSATNAIRYGYPGDAEGTYSIYIQNGPSGPIKTVSYHNLKKMMPESPTLLEFRRTRRIADAVILAGICGFFAGAGIAGNATMSSDGAAASKGMILMFGSMGAIATTTVPLWTNRMKLRRAIAIHNGVLKPKTK